MSCTWHAHNRPELSGQLTTRGAQRLQEFVGAEGLIHWESDQSKAAPRGVGAPPLALLSSSLHAWKSFSEQSIPVTSCEHTSPCLLHRTSTQELDNSWNERTSCDSSWKGRAPGSMLPSCISHVLKVPWICWRKHQISRGVSLVRL